MTEAIYYLKNLVCSCVQVTKGCWMHHRYSCEYLVFEFEEELFNSGVENFSVRG